MCYVVAQIGLDLENSLGLEGKASRTQDTSRGSVTTTFDYVKPNLSVEVVPILKHLCCSIFPIALGHQYQNCEAETTPVTVPDPD